MRKIVLTAFALAAVGAGASQAATARLTDNQFVTASRCSGLTKALGADASAYENLLRSQRGGRADHIRDRASDSKRTAEREARAATGAERERLTAETAGACAALLAS